ncbi:MAG: AhpC/TSA family protein [Bacteroidales bacterium]|nr:AhpC/TSA family protein [Bacteroidales bacterium]
MKNFNLLAIPAALLLAVSCGSGATVNGKLSDAPEAKVVVKLLDVNRLTVLDTLTTGKDGSFRCKVEVAEGDPEFVYLFHNDTKIASLLLESGDNVKVEADTLGNCIVTGSENSSKLSEVEARSARFLGEMNRITDTREFVRKYIAYYRESVKYVMSNPYSLTVIPVLYENLGDYAPVFAQATDALHFRAACDSLKTVYPDSRYVKALEKETARREQELKVQNELMQASSIGFPDLKMPDVKGVDCKLSDVNAKVVLVNFWDSADPIQCMFTKEVLVPLYQDYHKRGLEIYSVSLDTDKAHWASVVSGQGLPWINVNDGKGAASPSLRVYNVQTLPSSVLICDGTVISSSIQGETGLRRELSRLLK